MIMDHHTLFYSGTIICIFILSCCSAQFTANNGPTSLTVQAVFKSDKFRREMEALIPKGYEIPVLSNLLLTTFWGSKQLLNPCGLNDFVRKTLPGAVALSTLTQPFRAVPRNVVLNQVTAAISNGCNLYRDVWVLQETKNLSIYIDQNTDHVFDGTVLQNYSHFYFWADGINRTNVLFLGLMRTDDLNQHGATFPALKFLSAMGLRKHPWRFVEFENLPPGSMRNLVSDVRVRTAEALSKQGTFWEEEQDYINFLLTSNYNGPETLNEIEMFGIMTKAFSEEIRKKSTDADNKYDLLCADWDKEHNPPSAV